MGSARPQRSFVKAEPASKPRLRSDARRNRDDILAVAVRAFASDTNASLEGIARDAGVGIGTLYRHFPTREVLIEAAFRSKIAELCEAAPRLLAAHPPDVALARFLDLVIEDMTTKRGMNEAMLAVVAAGDKTPLTHSLSMMSSAVAPLIEAGRQQGLLRDDVTVDDFLTVKGAIIFAGPEKGRRLAAILLDGLRAHGATHAKAKRRRKT